jgi:D-alanine-D-alanine ligase
MKKSAKILICYNPPVSVYSIYTGKPIIDSKLKADTSEIGFSNELEKIKRSLQKYFTNVKTLPVERDIVKTINEINSFSPDIIYNLVESVEGISSYEYCLTGVFELLGHHYTGNIPSCLGNCLNKARTKNILRSFGLKVAADMILKYNQKLKEEDFELKFPVILKLLNEDASIGISELSVVKDFKQLKKQLKFLYETYRQDIIIEEFIEGKELNVAILSEKILPISEIKFDGLPDNLPKIVTYEGKWIDESIYYKHTKPECPTQLNTSMKVKVEKAAMTAFKAMNCRDYARVDIRLNSKGVPYIIEVNPNPDITTDSGFARAARAAGISHDKLLVEIANIALNRFKDDKKNKAV